MDLIQLKYFQYLARYEHIGKVARELCVSQPAVSMSIKRLELELGANLFDRGKKSVKLNNNGKAFLKYVNSALNNINSGVESVQALNQMTE